MDEQQVRLRAIEIAADVFEFETVGELFVVANDIERYVKGGES